MTALLCLFLLTTVAGFATGAEVPLSSYDVDGAPWLHIAANSEQRGPVYLGKTPKSLVLGESAESLNCLPKSLKKLASEQFDFARSLISQKASVPVEFEAWPVRGDDGQLTWAIARWRFKGLGYWRWLEGKKSKEDETDAFIPIAYHPARQKDFKAIFDDFLSMDLYDKPIFGDCVWIDKQGAVVDAWLSPDLKDKFAKDFKSYTCMRLPRPSRVDGKPKTFLVTKFFDEITWPKDVTWCASGSKISEVRDFNPQIVNWPSNFKKAYTEDVKILAGELEAVFPLSGGRARFVRKNNAQTDNDLPKLVSWLEERYALLGIKTHRQDFFWRGEVHSNLIAIIPGRLPAKKNKPVLMADHIDTAFCDDIFEETGERVAAKGANDNMTAAAALLRAAEILRKMEPDHDIWLTHLTGEEFPGDDLGARHFVSDLLARKIEIRGLILMDMIGRRLPGGDIFQVNAGDSQQSLKIARLIMDAAPSVTESRPVLRKRFDPKSYLYNTDGLIFSDVGYPVVFLNEHINLVENFEFPGYHDVVDTSAQIDFDYAVGIVKVAIESAARLSKDFSF